MLRPGGSRRVWQGSMEGTGIREEEEAGREAETEQWGAAVSQGTLVQPPLLLKPLSGAFVR